MVTTKIKREKCRQKQYRWQKQTEQKTTLLTWSGLGEGENLIPGEVEGFKGADNDLSPSSSDAATEDDEAVCCCWLPLILLMVTLLFLTLPPTAEEGVAAAATTSLATTTVTSTPARFNASTASWCSARDKSTSLTWLKKRGRGNRRERWRTSWNGVRDPPTDQLTKSRTDQLTD